MANSEIFGQRLKNARIMRGYSMDDLCARIGNAVSKMAVSKYESGCMVPNSTIVIKLANALEMPIDYFFRPFQFEISDIQFRKKSRLPVKQEKTIKETVADNIERYLEIEETSNSVVHFEVSAIPVSGDEDVKHAARKLREDWNLGEDGIVNVIELLEEHGIKVVEVEASDSFDGFSAFVNKRFPVVVLNKTFQPERKRLTAVHELGHLILSFKDDVPQKDKERYCYLFGNEFLIPERVFVSIVGNKRNYITYPELASIQRCYGISCDALIKKANTCGVLSSPSYSSYFKRKNANLEFKSTVEQSLYPAECSKRFERLVYKALSSTLISEGKAASLLNIPLEDVRRAIALS